MLTVKFQKNTHGKNKLFYSIIITSKKAAPSSGKFIEEIGFYHPSPNKWKQKILVIDFDRLVFWLHRGLKINSSFYLVIKPLLSFNLKK